MRTEKELEKLIMCWHDSENGDDVSLSKFLGWTYAEYKTWVESNIQPDRLKDKSLFSVLNERIKQDSKWGEQNHDMFTWMSILMEEVGELARTEAVQVAAVALAIVECIDRSARKLSKAKRVNTRRKRRS
jgi:NTP pyrophosphatase (non-canonical NTP hydrolase)